jgi:hypothetical protein
MATCTTGTESAPSSASAGLDLSQGIGQVSVFVEANDGVTNLTAGTLDFYIYNAISGHWGKVVGLSANIPSGAVRHALPALQVAPGSRIAAVPTGLGTAVNVYINGLATFNS